MYHYVLLLLTYLNFIRGAYTYVNKNFYYFWPSSKGHVSKTEDTEETMTEIQLLNFVLHFYN